jgi:hypothetical protein
MPALQYIFEIGAAESRGLDRPAADFGDLARDPAGPGDLDCPAADSCAFERPTAESRSLKRRAGELDRTAASSGGLA